MGILGWMSKRAPQVPEDASEPRPSNDEPRPSNKRPKVDKDAAAERARKNSPWRFDDGPSRRPVGDTVGETKK
ncbi:hypothetical protein HYPP_00458 [Hyphomicrobium sp. ghe19]|nr:hypothetical protein HYPP_00458 [Hyphomicrobium sp. ghe19]